jgi:hypothetical protein
MTITEFLEARIDEDEERATSGWVRLGDTRWETDNYGRNFLTPSAVLAECAAKRALSSLHSLTTYRTQKVCDSCGDWWDGSPIDYPCDTIKIIAAVYAGHPDYQSDWAL